MSFTMKSGDMAVSSKKCRRVVMTALVCGAIAVAPVSAMAGDDTEASMTKEAGIGAGSAVASLIYAPIKLTYALGGLIVGGLAWAFSGGDANVASIVLTPSLRGDYVVTREQLMGRREVAFFGRSPEYRTGDDWDETPAVDDVAAAPPSRW